MRDSLQKDGEAGKGGLKNFSATVVAVPADAAAESGIDSERPPTHAEKDYLEPARIKRVTNSRKWREMSQETSGVFCDIRAGYVGQVVPKCGARKIKDFSVTRSRELQAKDVVHCTVALIQPKPSGMAKKKLRTEEPQKNNSGGQTWKGMKTRKNN